MKTQFMTVGFMFSEDLTKVALITKLSPYWQMGMLNGIGGKVEEGESFLLAQIREFYEETGVTHFDWIHVGELTTKMQNPDNPVSAISGTQVQFYAAATDNVYGITNMTDEHVDVYDVETLGDEYVITNLKFMIPHALEMLKVKSADPELPF